MKLIFLLLIPAFFSCKNNIENSTKIEIHASSSSNDNRMPYTQMLTKIDSLKPVCKTKTTKEAGIAFSKFIDENIVPYWIGTPWDFNGTTQTPNEGYIACGYLVTTILRDAGVKINRVKMAQCASEQMINSLTTKKENLSKFPFSDFIQKVKSKGVGLSIIGLDNHTGFLYFDGKELYFIHSSFVGEGKVAKEIASENGILYHSKYKVVGYISHDEAFITNWLTK